MAPQSGTGTPRIVMLIQDVHNYCGKRAYEDVDETRDDEIDEEEFKKEQNSVTCLIHMLYNDDLEEMLKWELPF
ncbi:hypothetical protein ZIOFF_018589 [Zingiber officinale]|uniref:Uncharacterized protein n=1 Tax=Zingiber officinale TaxID=94328 RepID=A0A8J5HGL5_ZINOF|nr:hypothetical protein ZIOFF_018589 [Zingiber officinale]